ncbi:MAG: two-component system, sensor histidine kinase YesM [Epulopiscium sp.]|jgi:two-component system sensor histidine kinase YesM|nr:Histidine kinase, gyrase and HSP90-like ATPase [Defluviitaleaceae bacterium]MDK2788541.1 two-component system, sensor histidine kinase YesM [Candidatus Epulonipiscium sp.]
MEVDGVKPWIRHTFGKTFGNLKLNRKIQISIMVCIIPLFILFMMMFFNISKMNREYNQIIANASEAGRFSIDFKEEFDYKIYLLIAGHSSFEEEDPYSTINDARAIAYDLIINTNLKENKQRAKTILKLLDNLERYVQRIEQNKIEGGHYDDNIIIWEKDIQIVTALIQSTVLEYTYYETKAIDQVRLETLENFRQIILYTLIIFGIVMIIEIALSIIIPNSIVKPIQHLNDVTKQVAKGDLSVRAKVLHGAEVKSLGESLNMMIGRIEYLLDAVKTEEKNLREAELELLQAQINPHFLYNTLDTIIWLAESGNPKEVVDMVKALSDFFRTSLNHGNGMFTLKEEERHVKSYLQIQHVRYQDILEYEIDLPDDIKDAIIPKITLQPIVENALYHGIKNRRGKGKISVTGMREGNDVVISIADNGAGMTPEQLNKITTLLNEGHAGGKVQKKMDSYGLYNVNQRIKLKFGNNYGLSISSVYGEGTCVKVRIPFGNSIP